MIYKDSIIYIRANKNLTTYANKKYPRTFYFQLKEPVIKIVETRFHFLHKSMYNSTLNYINIF